MSSRLTLKLDVESNVATKRVFLLYPSSHWSRDFLLFVSRCNEPWRQTLFSFLCFWVESKQGHSSFLWFDKLFFSEFWICSEFTLFISLWLSGEALKWFPGYCCPQSWVYPKPMGTSIKIEMLARLGRGGSRCNPNMWLVPNLTHLPWKPPAA